jgi:hypothetical protein
MNRGEIVQSLAMEKLWENFDTEGWFLFTVYPFGKPMKFKANLDEGKMVLIIDDEYLKTWLTMEELQDLMANDHNLDILIELTRRNGNMFPIELNISSMSHTTNGNKI